MIVFDFLDTSYMKKLLVVFILLLSFSVIAQKEEVKANGEHSIK